MESVETCSTFGVAPLLLLSFHPPVTMTRSAFPFSFAATVLLLASPAFSQASEKPPVAPAHTSSPPSSEQSAEPPTRAATAAAPEALDAALAERLRSYDERRRQALIAYKLGDVDSALADLRALVATCEKEATSTCPDSTRAKLYVALGIVLAGGKDDIQGAARLFHAALTRDPEVTVPRELATLPVQEAMKEANESTSYQELARTSQSSEESSSKASPSVSSASAPGDPAPSTDEEEESPRDHKTRVLLLHAILGTGADDFGDAPTFGAAGILGVRFVDSSAWTTAIRGRVAVVGINQETLAGAALMMGGSWYGQKHKRMGYFLGGVGLDSYGGEGGFSMNGMGGVTLGGFLIGGGAEFGGSDYGHFAMASLHLGWGGRL